MPELPEVETVRRQLAPALEGRVLERIEVRDPRWCDPAPPEAIEDALGGRRIELLGRRGKYLILSCEDDVHLVMHLRMTGNLLLVPAAEDDPERPHLRVRMELSGGERLLFVDVRRFGTGDVLLGSDALAEFFASRLGVEPLSPDFTAEALRAMARGRKQPVKAFLLNQERVAGVGNIYADEALFRARIHPLRPVGTLKRPQLEALRAAVVETLELGHRREGRLDRRLPAHRRRPGELPGPLSRAHAGRRALPALRDADREAARRRARDLHLPEVSAASAATEEQRQLAPVVGHLLGVVPLAHAASRSSSVPARSASISSRKPPIERFPTTIWGKVIWPVSATRSARPTGSLARLTSS